VTKKEVQDFIAANKVDVQEVMLGGNEAPSQDLLNWMSARSIMPPRNPEGWQELSQKLESYAQQHQKAQGAPEASQRYFTLSEEASRISEGLDVTGSARGATKHERWQLPGGENYREILLTLPEKAPAMYPNFETYFKAKYADYANPNNFENPAYIMAQRDAKRNWDATGGKIEIDDFSGNKVGLSTGNYTSSHFNEPNILAHMRVNDRIDAEGKKMLLIEEVQSDWHQAGRKQGYGPQYQESYRAYYTNQDGAQIGIGYGETEAQAKRMVEAGGWNTQKVIDASGNLVPIKIEFAKQSQKIDEGVPDAPFKDTWHQVALKRALKYAADNGYERVGLTTGKQQIDRYSNELRQNVDEIKFFPIGTKNNIQIFASKSGNDTFSGTIENGKFVTGPAQGKTVEEVLGKTMAKQIAEKKDGVIRGDDLTIGGEGMKAYYDEIYPAFLDKQSKKWNAKTGETTIGKKGTTEKAGVNYYQTPDTSAKVRYIDITPEMKGALAQGQPLHGLIPAIPAAGFGVEGINRQQNSLAPPTSNALFLSGAGP